MTIVNMSGDKVKVKPPVYNIRLCLIGSDDIDIKNIDTFGLAEDGFFMVKSLDNNRFPVFMTYPERIKTIEIYIEGKEPLTKLKLEKGDDDFLVDLLKKHNEKQKT
tara:strand:+ start:468 stop:785 length:318 start_codon:yes stop_codon:yes gene_type:complete